MTTPQMDKSNSEICTIRIMFPVDSDEQAIEAKKKISEAMADIPETQVQFAIMSNPARGT